MDTTTKDIAQSARHSNYDAPACPVEATLELIGGKCKGIILFLTSQRLSQAQGRQ